MDEPQRRQREAWDRRSADYDTWIATLERRFLGATRPWVCGRAHGDVLEVAGGTGLNLPHYPPDVALTFTDLSGSMLDVARRRAAALERDAEFGVADAMALPFPDASFDSVVCTFALCGVPHVDGALTEALRVLRPGGSLLLADHVVSTAAPARVVQRGLDLVTGRTHGEYWTRRPLLALQARGVPVLATRRRHAGVIECVHASRPEPGPV